MRFKKNFMKAKDNKQEEENREINIDQQVQNENVEEENVETEANDSELSDIERKDLEISALNDKYLRLYSEFDNYKRRTQTEKLELYKTAGEDVFKSLLPVVDDFERALKSMEETKDYDSLKTGVDLIFNKLWGVLKSNGAIQMESSIGKEFDSDFHDAITQIPAAKEELKCKVVDEIEKGYILNDKVIRYAKVVVGT